jgi:hypothetical protein
MNPKKKPSAETIAKRSASLKRHWAQMSDADRQRPVRRQIRPEPSFPVKLRQVPPGAKRKPMTVCIAAACKWLYPDNTWGPAIVLVSDRMMTAGDIEYEPPRIKVCFFRPTVLILVAGELSAHTESLEMLTAAFAGAPASGWEIATAYGRQVAEFRRRRAESIYLSPLGLTVDSFIQYQAQMSSSIAAEISFNLQNHVLDADAIVAVVENNHAKLYHVDGSGFVSAHEDTGFLAIGIGYPHANSQFMSAGYANYWAFFPTLALSYAAKKRAEVAPGVGKATDIHVLTRDGSFALDAYLLEQLGELHGQYMAKTDAASAAFTQELDAAAEARKQAKAAHEAAAPPPKPRRKRSAKSPISK